MQKDEPSPGITNNLPALNRQAALNQYPQVGEFEVLEFKGGEDDHSRFVAGAIRSSKNKPYQNIELELKLLNKNGEQVGSIIEMTSDGLKPGQVWHFKIPIQEEEAHQVEVMGIRGS